MRLNLCLVSKGLYLCLLILCLPIFYLIKKNSGNLQKSLKLHVKGKETYLVHSVLLLKKIICICKKSKRIIQVFEFIDLMLLSVLFLPGQCLTVAVLSKVRLIPLLCYKDHIEQGKHWGKRHSKIFVLVLTASRKSS